jgi:hypothetical protein
VPGLLPGAAAIRAYPYGVFEEGYHERISRTGPGRAGQPPGWRTVNITPAERLDRIAIGLAAIVAGVVMLTGAGAALAVALELLLVAADLEPGDHRRDRPLPAVRQARLPAEVPAEDTMRTRHDRRILQGRVVDGKHQPASPAAGSTGHAGHGWMMIACCIPMLVIAVVLVATGVASRGFLVVAVGCTLMLALMMRGMGHGGGDGRS